MNAYFLYAIAVPVIAYGGAMLLAHDTKKMVERNRVEQQVVAEQRERSKNLGNTLTIKD